MFIQTKACNMLGERLHCYIACEILCTLHLSTCGDRAALNVSGSMFLIGSDISDHLCALIDHFGPTAKLLPKLDILVVDLHGFCSQMTRELTMLAVVTSW